MRENSHIRADSLSLVQRSMKIKKESKFDEKVSKDKQQLVKSMHNLASYFANKEIQEE